MSIEGHMSTDVARNPNESILIAELMSNHYEVLRNLSEYAYDPTKDRITGVISIHSNHRAVLLNIIGRNHLILSGLDYSNYKVQKWIEIFRELYDFIEKDFYPRKFMFFNNFSVHEDIFCEKFLNITYRTSAFMCSQYSVESKCSKFKR